VSRTRTRFRTPLPIDALVDPAEGVAGTTGGIRPRPVAGSRRPRRPRRALSFVLVATVAVVLFAVGGLGLLRRPAPEAAPPVHAVAAPLQSSVAIESGSLGAVIRSLQARVRSVPEDWRALGDLGSAYVQQARVTADPTYYPKAEGVLRRSLAARPDGNFGAMTGMAALSAARHDFSGALSWARKATAANPSNA